jgi:hypothetical protein
MAKSLSFAGLVPEPLTFTDDAFGGDGARYDVLSPDLFTPEAFARFEQIQGELNRTKAAIGNEGQGVTSEIFTQLGAMTDELIAILIPQMPAERRQAVPFGFKMRFLQWWQEETRTPTGGVGGPPLSHKQAVARRVIANASGKTPRGKPSRGSSPATASTPEAS